MKSADWIIVFTLAVGIAAGWQLHDGRDTDVKAAVIERNKAETQYYQAATKREERELQMFSGYAVKK